MSTVVAQLDTLRALWNDVPSGVAVMARRGSTAAERVDPGDLDSVGAWERTLADALAGNTDAGPMVRELCRTKGIGIYRHLIATTRFSAVTRGAERTVTLLLAARGGADTRQLLTAFIEISPAHSFYAVEALNFLNFLTARFDADPGGGLANVPYLAEVAAWERAVLHVHLGERAQTVTWSADPAEIFARIDAGQVPARLPHAPQRVRVAAEPVNLNEAPLRGIY